MPYSVVRCEGVWYVCSGKIVVFSGTKQQVEMWLDWAQNYKAA